MSTLKKRAKIMVIDDTAANLKLLDNMLRNQGYQVFSFPRGEMALKGAEKNPPDLVLLDINMPGMNGFEVCERLKSDDRFKQVPVIFISALNETIDKIKAFNVGGIDYITKPFQFEEVIARIRTHLRLREYQEQLLEAKKDAEAAAQAKSEFLANMSHEIRTPMNAILGFLELVLEDESLQEFHRQHLFTAHISAIGLLGIINDILDLSKLESGNMNILKRPFNLSRLMQEIYETMKMKAGQKDLALGLDIHPSLSTSFIGDPLRIRQILINLVGNAVKFTEKGKVSIKVLPMKKEGELYFKIEDTGIGMPRNMVTMIFEPFVQADSSASRQFEGTGLGTTISRKLVELMEGRIWVDSIEGKGSTFHFIVNMEPTDQILEDEDLFVVPGKRIPVKTQRHLNVLVAEDTEINVDLVKLRLEQQGHTVFVAWNGLEAIDAFKKEELDMILMDIQMPKMGGIKATKHIRDLEMNTGKHIPIIALTASVMKEETDNYLDVGMDAVVAKPIDFKKLFSAMEESLVRLGDVPGDPVSLAAPDTAAKDLFLSEAVEGIDLNDVLTRTGGDRSLVKKMLNKFLVNQRDVVEHIRVAIVNKDWDNANQLVHTLKGLAGNIGALQLFRATEKMETAIKGNDKDLISPLAVVSDCLSVVFSSIVTFDETGVDESLYTDVSSGQTDAAAVLPLMDELKILLEDDNTDAVRKLGEIKVALKGTAIEPDIKLMEEILGRYDFEKALELLRMCKGVLMESVEKTTMRGDDNG